MKAYIKKLCFLVKQKGGEQVTTEFIHRQRWSVGASAGMLFRRSSTTVFTCAQCFGVIVLHVNSYYTNNECSGQRSPISMSACALCDLRLFAMLGIWRVKHFTCCACLFVIAQSGCCVLRWRFSCWLDLLNMAQCRAEPERTGDIFSGIFVYLCCCMLYLVRASKVLVLYIQIYIQ